MKTSPHSSTFLWLGAFFLVFGVLLAICVPNFIHGVPGKINPISNNP